MSKPPLSEQLGAMALVDELRHQQMQLQEHLDLAQRQAEVTQRIRAYYQHQGIPYDDELVERGVREFFARRFEFEAPALAWHERLRVSLVIPRHRLILVALGLGCIFVLSPIQHFLDRAFAPIKALLMTWLHTLGF
jgi:hypothetical protein